jgi:biopolymer transport protein ExbD
MQAAIQVALADNPKLRIHVRADQATSYNKIKEVLRCCAAAGAYEVIYATYQSR